ncbi:acyl-CoA dehydrogenase family protein [Nocardioides marmoribigeumensis]|uniref:Alkylation response protein AidB-like acyl-CoA dehydrogenase n=1 Tax=Nocardioides marmoribigeumensis TaxID=433649 RepID=A0ABU2C1S4_9ACTN|nr:acyl-CoA dehydrogenase family protein [Nocardioides marmoribigeumensis]MDR7364587.1 alkylation response protein AidB-like acyl-CoA dehydrogenase [Nocardioides marmoribigeumensis]
MRFELTEEQRGFGASLADLLKGADVVGAARAWGSGSPEAGLTLWRRLADQGLCALVVPESAGGLGGSPVDLCVAFEQLGRHAVPGPWVESAAYLPVALAPSSTVLGALAEGEIGTVAALPVVPRALDAHVADHVFLSSGQSLSTASAGSSYDSIDPARTLFDVLPGDEVEAGDLHRAFDLAVLATSAQLLGLGEHLLSTTVDYVKQRKQFGREIGSYQALKHRLADVRIALDFVRPLVFGAAVQWEGPDRSRDVAAAKVAASDGAHLAARTALQLHGAIGYTQEYDASVWILRTRALVSAWGTPQQARRRVLASLEDGARA